MFFSDVFESEERGIEPVSRYNAVNMLLRSGVPAAVEAVPRNSAMGVVQFFNRSEKTIPRFSAVALAGIHPDDPLDPEERADGQAIFTGEAAVDDSVPWGIAMEQIAPDTYGEVAVSGCVPAIFYGTGKFVVPGSSGLTAGSSGSARVLLYPGVTDKQTAVPGLLLLGAASPAKDNEYFGIFKLGALSAQSLEVFNSYDPDSEYCGSTDVPGLNQIPRTVMTFEDGSYKEIFLAFFYDSDTRIYSCRFCTSLPENTVFSQLIGTFQNGFINQIYRQSSDRRMIFGEEWYLR